MNGTPQTDRRLTQSDRGRTQHGHACVKQSKQFKSSWGSGGLKPMKPLWRRHRALPDRLNLNSHEVGTRTGLHQKNAPWESLPRLLSPSLNSAKASSKRSLDSSSLSRRDSNTAYTARSGLQTRKLLRLVPCARLYGVARLAWASCEAHRCKWLGRSCSNLPCEPFPQQQQRCAGQL
eukprot:351534-Chlamydomonas_euryale.AAC.1